MDESLPLPPAHVWGYLHGYNRPSVLIEERLHLGQEDSQPFVHSCKVICKTNYGFSVFLYFFVLPILTCLFRNQGANGQAAGGLRGGGGEGGGGWVPWEDPQSSLGQPRLSRMHTRNAPIAANFVLLCGVHIWLYLLWHFKNQKVRKVVTKIKRELERSRD